MSSAERNTIFVSGGGVGGLACALALAQSGRPAHVLEAAPELGEIGAGIQLAPNATRSLDSLGLLDSLSEQAVFPEELVYLDALTGERITSLDLGPGFVEHFGHPYIVIHRSDLHSALLKAALANDLITLETDRVVQRLEQDGSSVHVTCAGGQVYEASGLIGADGLHSVARRLVSDDEPVPSAYVAYRGTLPTSEVAAYAGQDSMLMWVAPELHLVQYKLRGGDLFNQVGVFRSHRYGEEDWGSPSELDWHFGRCCEPVAVGASLLGRAMRWPMFDREPIDEWTSGRVTLLGDAAHPMLQYIAQGGCQALEDAAYLGRMVAEHEDITDAFAAYQRVRIPRTAHVQRTARQFGDICHIHGVGMELRNALFRQHDPRDYDPIEWLYGADGRPTADARPPLKARSQA